MATICPVRHAQASFGAAGLPGASAAVAIELNLPLRNTAYRELITAGDAPRLLSLNAIAHPDRPERPERQAAITFA